MCFKRNSRKWNSHENFQIYSNTLSLVANQLIACWYFWILFSCLLIFVSKLTSSKRSFGNTTQSQTVWIQIRPNIFPNCLQRLLADSTSRFNLHSNIFFLHKTLRLNSSSELAIITHCVVMRALLKTCSVDQDLLASSGFIFFHMMNLYTFCFV